MLVVSELFPELIDSVEEVVPVSDQLLESVLQVVDLGLSSDGLFGAGGLGDSEGAQFSLGGPDGVSQIVDGVFHLFLIGFG